MKKEPISVAPAITVEMADLQLKRAEAILEVAKGFHVLARALDTASIEISHCNFTGLERGIDIKHK
jgi:hypothetical protein